MTNLRQNNLAGPGASDADGEARGRTSGSGLAEDGGGAGASRHSIRDMPGPAERLTGGDWENRANEYWRNWHRSARIAGEEQIRREEAEREVARLTAERDALAAEFEERSAEAVRRQGGR